MQMDLRLSTLRNLFLEILQLIPVEEWSAYLGEMNLEFIHVQLV